MLTCFLTQYHSREWEDLTAQGFLTAQVKNGMALVVEADALVLLESPAVPCCDICDSYSKAAWRYPVRSFQNEVLPNLVNHSVEDFAVCEACNVVIAADDRIGLLER